MSRQSPHAIGFLFVTVGLDALALGLVVPVLPGLIAQLGRGNVAHTAVILGAFGTIFAVLQIVAAPILGALSDAAGRRPVILISNLGLGCDFLIMALAPTLPWLFLGRALSGAASASGPAAYAYLADVTPPERRSRSFGLLFAAQALGAAMGPALGGLLSGVGPRAPFWLAAALALANALYGLFVLPESLPPERRARLHIAQMNPAGPLVWLLRTHPRLALMVACAFLLSLASQGANSIAVLYATFRFAWSPRACGLLLAAYGLAGLVAQATLVDPSERLFGARRALAVALSLTTIGLAIFGLAPTGGAFSLAVPFLALGALSGPFLAGYFSAALADDEQGRLQGAWSSINSLMGLLAPGLFAAILARAAPLLPGPFTGAPFLASALMVAVAAVLGWIAPWRRAT
jgi:DHA1 family tetracycline resistance protein-like MFS transporter